MNSSKRAGIGVCTAAAVAVTACLALAPAAHAATTPLGGIGGAVTGAAGAVTGAAGAVTGTAGAVAAVTGGTAPGATGTVAAVTGVLTGSGGTASGSPVTVTGSNGAVAVGVGGVTVGVTTGGMPGVGVTTGVGIGVGATIGGSTGTGTLATGTVATGGGAPAQPAGPSTAGGAPTTTSGTPAPTSSTQASTPSGGAAPAVTALRITPSVDTVYPAKDGYRDTAVLRVTGTTAAGTAQPVSGFVVVRLGSTEVKRFPLGSSNQTVTWDGLNGTRIVAGRYDVLATATDATGSVVTAAAALAVSGRKLVTASHSVSSPSISGTHAMTRTAREGLSKGKVLLRLTTRATGVTGRQYLVFSHAGTRLKVLIKNGTHTSKAVVVPKSFTSYRISHTWKKGTVTLKSVVYKYSFKKLG